MGRINKTNKTTPVSADEFIIYDSENTSDDKNITVGQMATFTETQNSTIAGSKIFTNGVQFEKGNIAFGQYTPFPTTVGSYVASYVSPVYGPRILGYNGSTYQDLGIGSMPTAGTVSMKSLANGDCNFGYNVNIAEDLGVTGDVTANKFIGDGSELTGIVSVDTVIALGTISTGTTTLTADKFHTVTFSGAATIALPTGLTSGVHYNCSLLIIMSSVVTITQPTVTWAYGVTPSLTSTTKKYRITYETINGGTTWYGYWTQLGA